MATEFVMVPVPVERVREVYAVLAGEAPGDAPTKAADDEGGDPASTLLMGDWSEELIARAYRESPGSIVGIFNYLSDNPGREVIADELAQHINRTRAQMAGALGAFGRRTKNRYGRQSWPFHAWWSHESHRVIYKMDADVAEVIREARGI